MGPSLRRSRLVPVLAVLATSCAWPMPLPEGSRPAGPTTESACEPTVGQRVLDGVNAIRREHRLEPLIPEQRLADAARLHSVDQTARDPLGPGHTGSDGSTAGERVSREGYAWSLVAENVAAGQPTPDAVLRAWMNSPPHRATILSPDARHAGAGYARSAGVLTHYWTLVVAAPGPGEAGRPLDCHP